MRNPYRPTDPPDQPAAPRHAYRTGTPRHPHRFGAYKGDVADVSPGRRRMWRLASAASVGVLLVVVMAAAGLVATNTLRLRPNVDVTPGSTPFAADPPVIVDAPLPPSSASVDAISPVAGPSYSPLARPASPTHLPMGQTSAPPAPRSSPSPPPPETKSTVPGKAFVVRYVNKCLRAAPGNGSDLKLWTCDGSADEAWDIKSDGTIRSGGYCMDAAWAGKANGTTVWLASCNGTMAQQFQFNSSNNIVGRQSGRCVDVRDSGTADGTAIQLWDCNGSDNQKYSYV